MKTTFYIILEISSFSPRSIDLSILSKRCCVCWSNKSNVLVMLFPLSALMPFPVSMVQFVLHLVTLISLPVSQRYKKYFTAKMASLSRNRHAYFPRSVAGYLNISLKPDCSTSKQSGESISPPGADLGFWEVGWQFCGNNECEILLKVYMTFLKKIKLGKSIKDTSFRKGVLPPGGGLTYQTDRDAHRLA